MKNTEKKLRKPIKVSMKNGIKIYVSFQVFNEKVVKCTVVDGNNVYTAVSKCNFDEGDKFNREAGEMVALEKAMDKRDKHISRVANMAMKELLTHSRAGFDMVTIKFHDRWNK